MGRKFSGNPTAWKMIDGKLYLSLNKKVQERWVKNVPGFVRDADHNWPIIQTVTDASLEAPPPFQSRSALNKTLIKILGPALTSIGSFLSIDLPPSAPAKAYNRRALTFQ